MKVLIKANLEQGKLKLLSSENSLSRFKYFFKLINHSSSEPKVQLTLPRNMRYFGPNDFHCVFSFD